MNNDPKCFSLRRVLIPLVLFAISLTPLPGVAEVILGSWNIQNLGWDNDKRYDKVAHVANHFDFLAIQELMNEVALERLEIEVEALSGESWSSMASHALGRSSYREHYAFLWRDSAVEYVDGAAVFFDSGDIFSREPYSARFRSLRSGQVFAVANVHVVYGSSLSDRLPEIEALADYWEWLGEAYHDTPRLLMGDFNLMPHHDAWDALRVLGVIPAITQGATTLSATSGRYVNLYDNIWKFKGRLNVSERGIVKFPVLFGIDHTRALDEVSDHAPVYLALGSAELNLRPFTTISIYSSLPAANDPVYCIDLNTSDFETLQKLPHIGPVRAKLIIDGRPWTSVEQLVRIEGIGGKRLKDIIDSKLLCNED
ncbi:helix-hairpin-helix domain-containing protein [Halomonas sp. ATCH28]|uniref:Helix-hairpin-helix domain-containing protein n=1 Tax=Halomonas gemina TaxID=2945105 RepID=A0ABT0T600_9GAMM|nr:helix-hairpin-helix domain-containing protein [Halomonas gemina]MCL7942294.1 helix-hairpin-helix domain-containing protein [Halomonas gemina]